MRKNFLPGARLQTHPWATLVAPAWFSRNQIFPNAWNINYLKRLQMLILRFSAAARHSKNFLPGARLQTHPWATLVAPAWFSRNQIFPNAWNINYLKRLQMLILRFSAAARHSKNFLPGARLQTHPWATLLDFLEIRWSAIVPQECVWIHIHHSLNTDDTSFSCNLYFTMMKLIFWYLT